MNKLRDILKSETRESHAELDRMVMENKPFSSLDSYRRYLRVMWVSYSRFSRSLDWTSAEAELPISSERILMRIQEDLGSAFVTTRAQHVTADPSHFGRWGHAYVLEGATMGARILSKIAKDQLGPGVSTRFLDGAAIDSHERWPAFVAALNGVDEDGHQTALRGARQAFQFVTDQFSRLANVCEGGEQ